MGVHLTDQGGNKIFFGAAGVCRCLMSPVSIASYSEQTFAMVWCEVAESYIIRDGKGARSCTFTVIWWDSEHEDAPQRSREYEHDKRKAAITHFLKLCKRDPLYENT